MRTNTRPDARWTTESILLWLIVCGALALACFLLSSHPASVGAQDFRGFYVAGQMVLRCPSQLFAVHLQKQFQDAAAGGSQLVTFEHPAYEALLFAPLSLFQYRTAYLVYAGWNMLLLWLCYLLTRSTNSSLSDSYRPALFFLSFPVLLTIFVGQDSILFLLAVCLTYNALAARNDWRAGLILGLVSFKLAIVAPLAVLLSIRRGRKFISGFLSTALACAALSIWLTGIQGTQAFLHLLSSATLSTDHSVQAQYVEGIWLHAMPNLAGLFYLLGSGHLSPLAFNALNLAGIIALLAACAWLQRRAITDSTAFASAVACSVLVSPHLYVYDLAVLPVVFLTLSSRWTKIIAVLWFVLLPLLYAISYPYLMWFAPAVVVPLLLLAVCFSHQQMTSISDALNQPEHDTQVLGHSPNTQPSHLTCSNEQHAD